VRASAISLFGRGCDERVRGRASRGGAILGYFVRAIATKENTAVSRGAWRSSCGRKAIVQLIRRHCVSRRDRTKNEPVFLSASSRPTDDVGRGWMNGLSCKKRRLARGRTWMTRCVSLLSLDTLQRAGKASLASGRRTTAPARPLSHGDCGPSVGNHGDVQAGAQARAAFPITQFLAKNLKTGRRAHRKADQGVSHSDANGRPIGCKWADEPARRWP
jgi:hypothetical protein